MGNFEPKEDLTKTILSKRAQSIPLTDKEELYARQLFNHLLVNKKSLRKVVRVITGNELRKGMLDAAPTRTDNNPREVDGITNDVPDAQPDTSARGDAKLPDLDGRPNSVETEQERLSNILQTNVGVPSIMDDRQPVVTPEPAAKFVSADPVKVGDTVVKNFAKDGQVIVKGIVTDINKNGMALVKWSTGTFTHEVATQLVKAKLPEADKSVKDKDHTYEIPVAKGAITHEEAYERVKDQPGVEDPHAVAQHIVEQAGGEEKVKKDGDIVAHPPMPVESGSTTPFEGLVCSLQAVLDLGRRVKNLRETAGDDEEVCAYYDDLLHSIREMAEQILAALQMELSEAKSEVEE